jgi:hypothetical protein
MSGRARAIGPNPVLGVVAIGLIVVSCGPTVVWYGHTPDRRHRVEVLEKRGCQYVSVDGVEGPRFDGVAPETVKLNDDATVVAYAGKLGEQWRVMYGGGIGSAWDGIGAVVMAPGAKRVAYAAQRGDSWNVVCDGRIGPVFDELKAGSLGFSPDGKRFAYIGQRRGSVHAVIDGRIGPAFRGIAALVFSEDGRRVGYLARGEDFEQLVVDGRPLERFDEVSEFAFGSGDHVAFLARDPDGWFAVVDGERRASHDAVFGLAFAPDGETPAFVARDRGLERLIAGEDEGPPLDLILPETLIFDPDTGEPVYGAAIGEAAFIVRNGEVGPPFDRVGIPEFAPGDRLVYTAEIGDRGILVIGGEVIDEFVWAGSPAFSPDGARMAYIVRQGDRMQVIVDSDLFAYDVVVPGSLVFSEDGAHWACLAGSFAERELRLTIDGEPTERIFAWDELIADVSVDPFAYKSEADALSLFRDWVVAELALELESRPAPD